MTTTKWCAILSKSSAVSTSDAAVDWDSSTVKEHNLVSVTCGARFTALPWLSSLNLEAPQNHTVHSTDSASANEAYWG